METKTIPYTQTHLPKRAGIQKKSLPIFIEHTYTQTAESETEDKQTSKQNKHGKNMEMTMKHSQLHFALEDDDDHFDCVQLEQHRKCNDEN